MNEDIKKEIVKINERLDMLFSEMEKRENEKRCAVAPNIEDKTYNLVKRMKFDNDIQREQNKLKEINKEIDKLEKERTYILREIEEIDRKYYQEY